jgi:hypothetical protein
MSNFDTTGIRVISSPIDRKRQLKPHDGMLTVDTVIQGIKFAKGTVVFYYTDHKLWSARLTVDQKIQGIKCAKGTYVIFYPNGKIWAATLAVNQTIQGTPYTKGTEVYFKNGKVVVK